MPNFHTLAPGKYYVGDVSTFINSDDLFNDIMPGLNFGQINQIEYMGVKMISIFTQSNGTFKDNCDSSYVISSGCLFIADLESILNISMFSEESLLKIGNIITTEYPVDIVEIDYNISIGPLTIYTNEKEYEYIQNEIELTPGFMLKQMLVI